MNAWHKLTFLAGTLALGAAGVCAQTPGAAAPCLAMNITLNNNPMAPPQLVTFKAGDVQKIVPVSGECFPVPAAAMKEKTVNVSFAIAGSTLEIPDVATTLLAGPWEIELQDKKFQSDIALPPKSNVRAACYVVFHEGDPEIAKVVTPCRKPS